MHTQAEQESIFRTFFVWRGSGSFSSFSLCFKDVNFFGEKCPPPGENPGYACVLKSWYCLNWNFCIAAEIVGLLFMWRTLVLASVVDGNFAMPTWLCVCMYVCVLLYCICQVCLLIVSAVRVRDVALLRRQRRRIVKCGAFICRS